MFKVAIAGCGLISQLKYIPMFQKLKSKVKIVGVCDLNEEALKQVSSKFGIPDTFKDFEEMLFQKKPDIVVVCTPPATHSQLVIGAFEKGAHVLVEKPMALKSADCVQMIEASRKFNKKLGVMHNQIFNPAFEKACNIAKSGKIGRFLGMRILLMTSIHDMTKDQNHWAHRLPGGLTGETGPHAVYLSQAFLENIRDVNVISMKHFPEYAWCIGEDIRFDLIADNGFSSISLIYGSNQTAAEVDIIGTDGYLKVDLQTRIVVNHNRLQDNPLISAKSIIKSVITGLYQTGTSFLANGIRHVFSRKLDGHHIGVNRFLDFVSGKAEFPATGEKGKEVERVMEMIIQKLEKSLP